ncbi:hypothetical protein FQZ97_836110 [compost metagenome]
MRGGKASFAGQGKAAADGIKMPSMPSKNEAQVRLSCDTWSMICHRRDAGRRRPASAMSRYLTEA